MMRPPHTKFAGSGIPPDRARGRWVSANAMLRLGMSTKPRGVAEPVSCSSSRHVTM